MEYDQEFPDHSEFVRCQSGGGDRRSQFPEVLTQGLVVLPVPGERPAIELAVLEIILNQQLNILVPVVVPNRPEQPSDARLRALENLKEIPPLKEERACDSQTSVFDLGRLYEFFDRALVQTGTGSAEVNNPMKQL